MEQGLLQVLDKVDTNIVHICEFDHCGFLQSKFSGACYVHPHMAYLHTSNVLKLKRVVNTQCKYCT